MGFCCPLGAYLRKVTPTDAAAIAERLLSGALPRRWRHTCGVARAARTLAARAFPDAALLESAAWLHDIGYAPAVAGTGFHPLDGARHLASLGVEDDLIALVANHTNATIEADQRGLRDALADFAYTSDRAARLHPLLAYADMTTSPDGDPVTIPERLAEIYRRYPADHVVHRSIAQSELELMRLAQSLERE